MNMMVYDFIEGLSFLSTHLGVHIKYLLHRLLRFILIPYHFYSNAYKISIMTSSQCSIANLDWSKLDKYIYV